MFRGERGERRRGETTGWGRNNGRGWTFAKLMLGTNSISISTTLGREKGGGDTSTEYAAIPRAPGIQRDQAGTTRSDRLGGGSKPEPARKARRGAPQLPSPGKKKKRARVCSRNLRAPARLGWLAVRRTAKKQKTKKMTPRGSPSHLADGHVAEGVVEGEVEHGRCDQRDRDVVEPPSQ